MTREETLALLEASHVEAGAALDALKATWANEDEEIAARRAGLLEAHAQGARDRDVVRVRLGGSSMIEAERQRVEAAAEPEAKPEAATVPVERVARLPG